MENKIEKEFYENKIKSLFKKDQNIFFHEIKYTNNLYKLKSSIENEIENVISLNKDLLGVDIAYCDSLLTSAITLCILEEDILLINSTKNSIKSYIITEETRN